MRSETMQPTIPETGFVRLPQILAVFPVSRSTWWEGVKRGKYPAAVKLGANMTAWRAEDIRELIAKHAAKAA
jgi:prophage regulatory protein